MACDNDDFFALLGENIDVDDAYSISMESSGLGLESEVASATDGECENVMRYEDPEVLKEHMKKVVNIGRDKTTFKGVEDLMMAAEELQQFPPRLRQGQIIFGSVSIAHHKGLDDTPKGMFYNMISPGWQFNRFFDRLNHGLNHRLTHP